MSPNLARPLLHTVHLATFTVAFVTGLLLFLPALRAAVTGGYSLWIRDSHRWGGIAFAGLPALIILRFGLRALFAPPAEYTMRGLWQGMHLVVTIVMTATFTLTGCAIWWKRSLPESVVDLARLVHDGLTYGAAAVVGAHLAELGTASLVVRFRSAAARQPEA